MRIDPVSMNRSAESHAADLFTDREPESQVLKHTLAAHRRRLDDTGADTDAHHNVLVYYGVGGIGKSTLSERLEAWVKGELPLMIKARSSRRAGLSDQLLAAGHAEQAPCPRQSQA